LATALAIAALATGAVNLWAADPASANSSSAPPAVASSAGGVDMFQAVHDGDLGVQFIPHNSREATLILTNNTDQPLNVHLPEAFAATPVLAQLGQQGGSRTTGSGSTNKNQSVGSGTSGQQRPAGGGGAFSIPPERIVKLKLPSVCLEYGKSEPNAHIPYTVEPIESYTTDVELQELCRLLGTGTVDQQSAQAAAWHLANHLSWDKLANMKHFPHNSGFTRPVFSSDQIRAAMALTDKAIKLADARRAAASKSEKPSASSSSSVPASASSASKAAVLN
jgi:hypothetical protein